MLDTFLAVAAFSFALAATPGPNNMMLLASGANFGFRRTIRHILGVSLGFPAMVVVMALGFGEVFDRYPAVYQGLKIVAFVYLLYLAWRIATAAGPKPGAKAGRPIGFIAAAAFQWVNGKAWASALAIVGLYAPPPGAPFTDFIPAVLALVAVTLPVASAWCLFGLGIAGLLRDPRHARVFNVTMAILLVLSSLPALL